MKNTDKNLSRLPLVLDNTHWYGPEWGDWGYSGSLHLEGAQVPKGGNAVMGDGHAEWRDWEDMIEIKHETSPEFIRWF